MLLVYTLSPILLVVGVIFLLKHYRRELATIRYRDARLLATLPPTPIAQAKPGLVKFVGKVHANGSVMSYFDREPCVAHRMVTTTYEGAQRYGNVVQHNYRVSREWQLFPFWIDDGTGQVAVDARGAAIDYEVCHADEGGAVQEHRIRLGDTIAVVGYVDVAPPHAPGAPPAVRFVSPPLVSWRTLPETLPALRPPAVPTALILGSFAGIAMAVAAGQWQLALICAAGGALAGGVIYAQAVTAKPM